MPAMLLNAGKSIKHGGLAETYKRYDLGLWLALIVVYAIILLQILHKGKLF